MAYRLTDKVLNPTRIKRTSIQHVTAATHEFTIAALDYYADMFSRPGYKETAVFLRLLRKWFNTSNVKRNGLHNWHNEPTRKPVTTADEEPLVFLELFAEWMNTWLEKGDKHKKIISKALFMSSETV